MNINSLKEKDFLSIINGIFLIIILKSIRMHIMNI